jgi:predicted nucleic acid-binding protein
MRVFVDTNVALDILLEREHCVAAQQLFGQFFARRWIGLISPVTLSTVHYVCLRLGGKAAARKAVESLMDATTLAENVSERGVREAYRRLSDFEDALQLAYALAAKADVIATRNLKDFRASTLDARLPEQILAAYVN